MKILKYGEGYSKTVVCDECGSELEYSQSDVKFFDSEHINTTNSMVQRYRRSYIICPVCACMIDFGTDVLCEYKIQPPLDIKPTEKKRWWQR